MRATMSVGPPAARHDDGDRPAGIRRLRRQLAREYHKQHAKRHAPQRMCHHGTSSFACPAATRRPAADRVGLWRCTRLSSTLWLVWMPPARPWLPALSLAGIYRALVMVAKVGASSERVGHFDVLRAPC